MFTLLAPLQTGDAEYLAAGKCSQLTRLSRRQLVVDVVEQDLFCSEVVTSTLELGRLTTDSNCFWLPFTELRE
jgi:hypothetical protein